MNRTLLILSSFLLVLAFTISCIPPAPVLTPDEMRKIQTRSVDLPKEKVWSAVLEMLTTNGYSIAQMDINNGMVITDWKTIPKNIAQVVLLNTNTTVEIKMTIIVKSLSASKTSITLSLGGRTTNVYGGYGSFIVDPSNYDKVFSRIGERLGVVFPPLAPARPKPEKIDIEEERY